jgi:hypothetical protein
MCDNCIGITHFVKKKIATFFSAQFDLQIVVIDFILIIDWLVIVSRILCLLFQKPHIIVFYFFSDTKSKSQSEKMWCAHQWSNNNKQSEETHFHLKHWRRHRMHWRDIGTNKKLKTMSKTKTDFHAIDLWLIRLEMASQFIYEIRWKKKTHNSLKKIKSKHKR